MLLKCWLGCIQDEVNIELQELAREKSSVGGNKKKTMTIYSKPYFKDSSGLVSDHSSLSSWQQHSTDWVTTHLDNIENVEKPGNSKVVRKNEKFREKSGEIEISCHYYVCIMLNVYTM